MQIRIEFEAPNVHDYFIGGAMTSLHDGWVMLNSAGYNEMKFHDGLILPGYYFGLTAPGSYDEMLSLIDLPANALRDYSHLTYAAPNGNGYNYAGYYSTATGVPNTEYVDLHFFATPEPSTFNICMGLLCVIGISIILRAYMLRDWW
jgi:hypothetical protein